MTRSKEDLPTFLFSLKGRATRYDYLVRLFVPYLLATFVVILLDALLELNGILYSIFTLVMIVPTIAVAVRRIHDRGRSGWFLLLLLLPFVNVWCMVELVFLRGTVGANEYGADPLTNTNGRVSEIS